MSSENLPISEKSKNGKNEIMKQVTSNLYALAPLVIFAVIFVVVTFVTPYTKRGFYCYDDLITKPYVAEETVSTILCAVLALIMVFGAIIAVDLYNIITFMKSAPSSVPKGSNVQRYVLVTVECLIFLAVGVLIERSVVELTKRTIGELRPNFISVCFPHVKMYTELCSKSPSYAYIETTCPDADPDHVKEARLSFPSGHSSFIFYGAVAGIIYIRSQLVAPSRGLVTHIFTACQFGFFLLAWYVGISRIKDYWHHPWDVFCGAVIGTVIPILIWFISPLKRPRSSILRRNGDLNNCKLSSFSDSTEPSSVHGRDYKTTDARAV